MNGAIFGGRVFREHMARSKVYERVLRVKFVAVPGTSCPSCRPVQLENPIDRTLGPFVGRGSQQFSPTYQLSLLYRMAPCQRAKEYTPNYITCSFRVYGALPSIDYIIITVTVVINSI